MSPRLSWNSGVSTRKDYFDISPRSFDVPARGGEITVNISTDLDYTFDIVDSDWITLVSGEGVRVGELVFKVAENPDTAERTGVIQFCGGFNCYNVTVNQAGMDTEDAFRRHCLQDAAKKRIFRNRIYRLLLSRLSPSPAEQRLFWRTEIPKRSPIPCCGCPVMR